MKIIISALVFVLSSACAVFAEGVVYSMPLGAAKAVPVAVPDAQSVKKVKTDKIPWGVQRVNAPAAWAKGLTGRGVKVCVIDTGARLTHEDLKDNIAASYNVIKPGKPASDEAGHGTHVAGIIGAAKNGKGVVGVAPEVKLYIAKAMNSAGTGKISDLSLAVDWCVSQGVQIINMSVAGDGVDSALARKLSKLYYSGVLVVAGTGNTDDSHIWFPASVPFVVAVGASNDRDRRWQVFGDDKPAGSNYGPELDFIAPGENIYSTAYSGDRSYERMSGTSMASPHVAGLAALAVQAGAKTPAAIVKALASAARKLPKVDAEEQGSGLIDASLLVPASAALPY